VPDDYIGRFAPTPSGPLHFGSIVTALAAHLDARKHGGQWRLRIDDLDGPRTRPGACDSILRTLEHLGLEWDGPVVYQHNRFPAYQAAVDLLQEKNLLYPCYCTRQQTRGRPYPGTCRLRETVTGGRYSLRIKTDPGPVSMADRIQGDCVVDLQATTGDFIVKRADGLFAYHIAVVIDDAWQNITDVVRGADLFDSTPAQIYLQRQLGLPRPRYAHLPVAVNTDGRKISKRNTAASAMLRRKPARVLVDALAYLGQDIIPGMANAGPAEVLAAAVENWHLSRVPRHRFLPAPANASDT